MKLLKSLISKPLDNRGISHLLVPLLAVLLVGVGGTYMLVASHANPAGTRKQAGIVRGGDGTIETKHDCTAKEKCAVIMRVLPKASYTKDGKKFVGGVVDFRATKKVNGKTKSVNLSKSRCVGNKAVSTSVAGKAAWVSNLRYLKAGAPQPNGSKTKFGSCFTNISLTNVNSGTKVRIDSKLDEKKVKYLKGASSYSFVTLDAQDAVIRLHPRPGSENKSIYGFLTVRLPNSPLYRDQCLQPSSNGGLKRVSVGVKFEAGGKVVYANNTPLKYVVPKKGAKNPAHYCSGRIALPKADMNTTYTITADLLATPFMKAAHKTMQFTIAKSGYAALAPNVDDPANTAPMVNTPAPGEEAEPHAQVCTVGQLIDPEDGVSCVDSPNCEANGLVTDPEDPLGCIDPADTADTNG